MADVCAKAISANEIKNNNVSVAVSPVTGTMDTKRNGENLYIDVAELEVMYTDRFDDTKFYSS